MIQENKNKSFFNFICLNDMGMSIDDVNKLSSLLKNDKDDIYGMITDYSNDTPLESAAIEGLYDFLFHGKESSKNCDVYDAKPEFITKVEEIIEFDCFIVDFEDITFVLCYFSNGNYCILFHKKYKSKVYQIIDDHIF